MARRPDEIVVDVEIIKTIEELPNGWDDTHLMGVAVACVWQYSDRRMRVYGPEDVAALQERLQRADRISGYNIWNFDFPVIWSASRGEWRQGLEDLKFLKDALLPKTNDLLRRIWIALGLDPDNFSRSHGGWKLDDVARATLGVGKIGNGADAPRWFQAGKVQKVANYCADDVAVERDLADFIDRYGFVVNGRTGRVLRITA